MPTAAFRTRLDGLAAPQAVVIDWTGLEADPARPDLPRLRARLRGTAGGLHGLMHALETGTPLMAIEEADLDVERPADPAIGQKFPNLFIISHEEIRDFQYEPMHLELKEGSRPIFQKLRRINKDHLPVLKEELNKLLKARLICLVEHSD